MRVWIVANVLMLALGLATTFRVNEVIETFEEFVDESPEARQDDINDNIPAVFAATLGASLLANVLFGGSASTSTSTGPTLNKIDCKCGVEGTNRIIGGTDVAFANKYPWMTFVETTVGTNKFNCGGSIVASKFVLTAAHCLFKDTLQTMPVEASDVMVKIGDHDITTDMETTKLDQKTIKVAQLIIHENYEPNIKADGNLSPPGSVNDIALLELEEEVDLMDYTPVCLARAGINEAGMRGMAYGWGATGPSGNDCKDPKPTKPILQETELTVCSELESTDNGIVDGQLCAIGASSITYSGDSGGPLSIKSGNQHVQVGDTSFGPGCPSADLTDAPIGERTATFGRISQLRGWLEEKMPGATTCSNGFDADTMLKRSWSNTGPSKWRLQQQADTERRRQEDIDKKRRKEEKMKRKAEKKKKKQEKQQKRKEEAAAAAAVAAAAAAEATTESAAEETTLQ